MISGGSEAPITRMSIAGFCANTALSTNPDPKTHAGRLIKIVTVLLSVKGQGSLF